MPYERLVFRATSMRRRSGYLLPAMLAAQVVMHATEVMAQTNPPPPVIQTERADARFMLRAVKVTGSTVISDAAFAQVARPWIGKLVGSLELALLGRALSGLYESAGYEGSGVTPVDQAIEDGVVVFQAREVVIGGIEVIERGRWLKPGFTEAAFSALKGKPVLLGELRTQLLRMRESGLYDRLDAEVQLPPPGQSLAVLVLEAQSALPFQAQLTSANNRNPSIGHRRDELGIVHASLTGRGDLLDLRLGRTAGLNDRQLRYELPLPAAQIRLFASAVRSNSIAIEPATFRDLDIRSTSDSNSIGATWFWKDHPEERRALLLSGEQRRSLTTLLGIPFSFTPGLPDEAARSRTARLEAQWSRRAMAGGFASRFAMLSGRIENATVVDGASGITPAFRLMQGGVDAAWRPAADRPEWRLRGEWQYTRDTLLPADRLSLGGAGTVRGYRENATLRDRGAFIALETRLPGWTFAESFKVVTGAFVDAGWSRNSNGLADGGPERLLSAGLMFEAAWRQQINMRLHWARARDRQPGNDLQDRGIHFQIQFNAR